MRTAYPPCVVHFTRAERKLLAELIDKEIITPELFGNFYSERAYSSHISRIRKKLKLAGHSADKVKISTASGMGHFLTKENRIKLKALMAETSLIPF